MDLEHKNGTDVTSYIVFPIDRNIIPHFLPRPKEWEKYDDNCDRGDIKLNDNVLNRILSFSKIKIERRSKDFNIHHIKYNFDDNDNPYTIDEHQDWCKFTIIVYLNKSKEVRDEFWVEGTRVKEDVWDRSESTYKCLAFWGNASHYGKIYGKGKREILCFFFD